MSVRHLLSRPHPPFRKYTGSNRQMDVMVTVAAAEAVRIQRIMERDGVSEQQVRERMENQWPQEEKIKHSDFVIRNNPADFLVMQVYECIGRWWGGNHFLGVVVFYSYSKDKQSA